MPQGNRSFFTRLSQSVSHWAGKPQIFVAAASLIVLWAASGPLFGFNDTWQLVINTSTTIITFLMVFMIQRGQNKDAMAIQLKLNELVAAIEGASNRLISIEDLSEEDVNRLHKHYQKLAHLAKNDEDIKCSHSIEEAEKRHKAKTRSGELPRL